MMGEVKEPTSEQERTVPGPAAFSALRAEDEPWLESCFVPPPEFGRMAGPGNNPPFPYPLYAPFLSWGHFSPSLEDHLVAIIRAGVIVLFLALAHRPHWFFRLDKMGRRRVYETLFWNLPAALSVYLEHCRQAQDVSALREVLDPTFILPDPPGPDELLRWCDELDMVTDVVSSPSPLERWKRLQELLLDILGFPAIYPC